MSQTAWPWPGNPVREAPQQSLVWRQRSPSMWHQLARGHTLTPVEPSGAQTRLQQSRHDPQTVPSTPPLQNDGPVGAAAQVPRVAPWTIVQTPPQQSADVEQTSPLWVQKDEVAQRPFLHSFEQQSALPEHVLPSVLHATLSGAHLPFVHEPPQHAAELVQAPLSGVHVAAHFPATQLNEQQSVPSAHGWSVAAHPDEPPVPIPSPPAPAPCPPLP